MNTQSNSNAGSGCSSHELLAVAGWLVGNDTGSSSKWLAATAIAGAIPESNYAPSYPRDAADLGQCIRLIESAPSVRNALPLLADACEKWAALVGKWDALTILHNATPEKDSYRWRVVTSQMEMLFRSANVEPIHGEKDAIYTEEGEGPLCVECWRKTPEYILENAEHAHPQTHDNE